MVSERKPAGSVCKPRSSQITLVCVFEFVYSVYWLSDNEKDPGFARHTNGIHNGGR